MLHMTRDPEAQARAAARGMPFYYAACGVSFSSQDLTMDIDRVDCPVCIGVVNQAVAEAEASESVDVVPSGVFDDAPAAVLPDPEEILMETVVLDPIEPEPALEPEPAIEPEPVLEPALGSDDDNISMETIRIAITTMLSTSCSGGTAARIFGDGDAMVVLTGAIGSENVGRLRMLHDAAAFYGFVEAVDWVMSLVEQSVHAAVSGDEGHMAEHLIPDPDELSGDIGPVGGVDPEDLPEGPQAPEGAELEPEEVPFDEDPSSTMTSTEE